MLKNTNTSYIKLLILIAIYALLLVITVITINGVPQILYVENENGYLDLSGETKAFENNLFNLKGEWEYYPNRLLTPADFENGVNSDADYVTYPHYFKTDKENFKDISGCATYRTTVKLPDNIKGIGVYSRFQFGAYKIYLNDEMVCEIGTVSENIDEYGISYNSGVGTIYPMQTDTVEIIIQVQCYSHVDAGFNNPLMIGTNEQVLMFRYFLMLLNGMVAGFFAVLICYFLILFLMNKNKTIHLNFAIVTVICLFMTLMSYNETVAYNAVPTLSGEFIFKLEYLAIPAAAYFASMHILKRYVKLKYLEPTVIILTLLTEFVIILLPNIEVSRYKILIHTESTVLFIITDLVCLFSVARFIKNGKKTAARTAIFEFAGLSLLLIGVFLNKFGVLLWESFDFFPLAACVYCFIQIFALISYYNEIESDWIALTNNLESKVEERTAELIDLNKKYQTANLAKSEFLARMSHEIRTPMNAIIGMSDLISSENLDEVQTAYFKDIKTTSHALLHIINDILDFSKIESGKFDIIPTHFNFYSFVDNICSIAFFSAKSKDLHFESDISGGIPKIIYGDEIRIKQIVQNIISNAMKYTNEGYVKLSVGITEDDDENEQIYFYVSDSGIGIMEEDIPRIFKSFEQTDRFKNRAIVGTGLGLTISKQITDLMHGRIEVESEYGKGSTFKLFIPLVEGDENKVEVMHLSEKVYGQNVKVLVVDDNSINITVAKGILATHEIYPDAAESGFEAIKMVREKRYDIIFMDHMMPVMDGVEATAEIRNLGEEYKKIPIIALTANAVSGTKEMLIEMGLDDFLSKPIDRTALNYILAKWLPTEKIAVYEENQKENFSIKSEITPENDYNNILLSLLNMGEIEVQKAFSRVGGNPETYIKILSQFVFEMPDYIKKLNKSLDNGDIAGYAIIIHGIKGVLNNIGAEALGEKAYRLEKAGKNSELDTCKNKTPEFIKELKRLLDSVSAVLPQETSDNANTTAGNEEQLYIILKELSESCEIGDCNRIDELAGKLKTLDFGNKNDKIKEIIRFTESMDYEEASVLCSEVMKK